MSKCFCISAEVSAFVATVTSPVHAVANTYETNRDVLLTKQNTATVGSNANSTISQYTYTVNSIGQRVSRQQSGLAFATATTDAFSYNTRGEVTNSTNTLTPSANRAYSYDPIGNRLFATEGTTNTPSTNPTSKTYASNPLNQYTQINTDTPSSQPPQTTASPTYDLDGNMLTDGTGKSYTWDAENRLIQVSLPNGEVVKYFYDSGFRRIKREHTAAVSTSPSGPITTTTLYLYDSWNVIAETTTNTKTSATTSPSAKTYHWGLDLSNTLQSAGGVGGLLRTTYRPATADDTPPVPQLHYHLYDANGNTSELLDSSAAITAHYEYDAFGEMALLSGEFAYDNSFRFSSKSFDSKISAFYYGGRFFSATHGRWLSRDPVCEIGWLLTIALRNDDFKSYSIEAEYVFRKYRVNSILHVGEVPLGQFPVNSRNEFHFVFNNSVNLIDKNGYVAHWVAECGAGCLAGGIGGIIGGIGSGWRAIGCGGISGALQGCCIALVCANFPLLCVEGSCVCGALSSIAHTICMKGGDFKKLDNCAIFSLITGTMFGCLGGRAIDIEHKMKIITLLVGIDANVLMNACR